MFYDLLTRNSNEYFYEVPAAAGRKKGERAKREKEDKKREFVKLFANIHTLRPQETTTTTAENLKQKLERANYKMAVNKKQQLQQQQQTVLMLTAKNDREELKDKKKKTPSLEQEMNLARRACWCNNNNLKDLRKSQEQQQLQLHLKQKCCENCFKRLNDDNQNNANDNEEDNVCLDDDNDDDDDRKEENIKETTVLNGAKNFSKNFNKTTNNCNNTNDNNITTKSLNSFSSKNISNTTKTTTTTNSLSNNKTNLINKQKTETNEAIHLNTTTSPVAHSCSKSKDCANNFCSFSPLVNNETKNSCHNNTFLAYMHVLLLQMWLAFVEFCDKNTIKSDDPRFSAAQHRREHQNSTFASSSSTTNHQSSFHLKLLSNKKILFLFVVCVFFSCVNRIEARPNVENSKNNFQLESSHVIWSVATDINDVKAKDNSNPAVGSSATPNPHGAVSYGGNDDGGSDEGGHHDRYPLTQVEFDRVKTPFIIGVWILSASIAKIGFHMTPKLHLIFPESCLLIVVGVVIGVVLYFCTDVAVSPLTPNTFFFYMLPPIILDAGYFMPNRLFFDNLGTILLMAVVGTIFNVATIGGSLYACGLCGIYGGDADTPRFLDIFIFASLISAVDPVAVLAVFEEIHVNEILYIVVFGESLLNDAVTVVMYHMMEVYNHIGLSNIIAQDAVNGVGSFFVVALGGTVIGIIWGFLTGLATRFTDHVRVIEPIFIFVMAYLAYLNAEIFHMSGILAITFCGITMKNYVESNISQKSHTTVKYALKMLSSSSETVIFMFLGVATVNNNHVWNTWFVVLTILFCSFFRVIGVIVLSAIANRFRLHKLSRVDQFVMSYGGLRGAVAFALVLLVDERVVPQKNMFVTTTIAVIYFTVFLQGITIKPLVKILNVKRANKRKPTMNERIHERFMDHLMAGIEDIIGKTGNYNVRDKFKRFDNRFIRPLLIRDLKGAEPKIIETYSKLTMRDAIEVMRRNPSTIGQITGTESMSALFRNYTNNCIGGSPSLTNLDNSCSRNLDMHELDYNPSKKDLTDAKIHHLLAEELKPYRRHRRLSYSRHAVDDRDLSTQVNYKMQMNFRRMFNDRKHHKRSKRGASKHQDGVKQNHVSFHDFQQNGTTKQFSHGTSKNESILRKKLIRKHSHNSLNKYRRLEIDNYINDVLNDTAEDNPNKLSEVTVVGANDDWDDGLTFTAKSSLADNVIPEEDRNLSRDSGDERRVATPTATESQLPWKRQGDEISDAVQQNEFPAWASNKEYLAYNSPSATFLGGINKPKQPKSVIGLFRRESCGSRGGTSIGGGVDGLEISSTARGSDPALAAALSSMVVPSSTAYNPRLDKRSQSISSGSGVSEGHSGPFPVTASHRRNVRRGSMLELSGDTIPEESYYHGHSKSLCEPAGEEWESVLADAEKADYSRGNSDKLLRVNVREPLLPKLTTPRGQIRRGMSGPVLTSGSHKRNQVTTALLSTNSDFDDDDDDDDDDEDEDFDLYDDENIVVTTTTSNEPSSHLTKQGLTEETPTTTTTTTIRLTRNNDESII